jgi:hypothetical protein
MYIRNAILYIALASRINAYPWNRRQDSSSPIVIGDPIPENVTTVQLPDEVISSDRPTVLKNTTLPTPEENSTISHGGDSIVVPANITSPDTADNGTVSKIVSTDNGTVVVGETNTTTTRYFFRPGTYDSAPGVLDPPPAAFGLTGDLDQPDYVAALDDAAAQPSIPDLEGCTYDWQSVLGGANGTKGGLWALEDYVWLTSGNVQQGSIGDCGVSPGVRSPVLIDQDADALSRWAARSCPSRRTESGPQAGLNT